MSFLESMCFPDCSAILLALLVADLVCCYTVHGTICRPAQPRGSPAISASRQRASHIPPKSPPADQTPS